MKNLKSIVSKVVIILAGCFVFASFSPSLDGRVVVVEPGEFPQGLFAKTVGYLPGDIISVANISGESAVDLLVIGALDPSEGVAIMITPEAARAIGVDGDSNNIVKITKRSGQDERVYGTAVIMKQNFSQAENQNHDENEDYENSFEEEQTEINETDFDENQEDEFLEEESQEFDEEPFAEDENDETAGEEYAVFEEEFESEPEAEENEAFFEEELTEEIVYDEENADAAEKTVESEKIEEEIPDFEETDEIPAEPFNEDKIESEEIAENKNENDDSEIVQEEIPSQEDFEEEDDYYGEELVEELLNEPVPTKKEEPAGTEQTDEVEIAEDEDSEQPENQEEIYEEDDEESDYEYDEEEYEAIVLVPVDSISPAYAEEETENFEEMPEFDEAENEEIAENTDENQPEKQEKTEFSYEKYLAKSLRDLESGKYYIQIATLSTDSNILEIINNYANNYPIVIVPMAGGIRKQILIGPLSVDEYALVLERFKSYGYKDAFLRKIR